MYNYYLIQWVIVFFVYSFFGWLWECLYVSVRTSIKNKKILFVNRGFLYGPIIPIYGFSALVILISTTSAKDKIALIYLFGAIAATLLELITGTVMEQIFEMKYWDYSNCKFNYKGYICLKSSMFWGVLSVFLVEFIHKFVHKYTIEMPFIILEKISFILTVIFIIDFVKSVNEALDLKELTQAITENDKVLSKIEKRINGRIAFANLSIEKSEIKNKRKRVINGFELLTSSIFENLKLIKTRIIELELVDREELFEQIDFVKMKMAGINERRLHSAISQLKRNNLTSENKHKISLEILKKYFN